MRVLITGGTGFLGSALTAALHARGAEVIVLSRDRRTARKCLDHRALVIERPDELDVANAPDAVVNLAGANLGAARWTAERKQMFIDSRVGVTERVVHFIRHARARPRVLVNGSAVGYYGARGEEDLDESAPPGEEFQSELCRRWEAAAQSAEGYGVRVCYLRTGAVLGPGGGPLAGLLPPFRLGLGAHLGDGRQWLSWIHLEDWLRLVQHLIERDDLDGPFNATAPEPVRNRELAKTLGAVLHRPVALRIPAWAARVLWGEMARMLVTGQRVLPRRALDSGFAFRFPELRPALEDILDVAATSRRDGVP